MAYPSNLLIERWAKYTDNNQHDEVRIEIAEWFHKNTFLDMSELLCVYRAIKEEHARIGELTPLLEFARMGADAEMFRKVSFADDKDGGWTSIIRSCL